VRAAALSNSPDIDTHALELPQDTPGPRPDLFNDAPLIPGNRGNSGGKKGRSGRLPSAWKDFCRETMTNPQVQAKILKRARRGEYAILKLLADHGEGMPEQKITVDADAGAVDRFFARLAPQPPQKRQG
jgi:hypothetical protein